MRERNKMNWTVELTESALRPIVDENCNYQTDMGQRIIVPVTIANSIFMGLDAGLQIIKIHNAKQESVLSYIADYVRKNYANVPDYCDSAEEIMKIIGLGWNISVHIEDGRINITDISVISEQ